MMHLNDLKHTLRELRQRYKTMSRQQRLAIAKMLFDTATDFAMQLRSELQENDAATQRRNAKRRETEVDPKPPVKPVRVAEPPKPKKPKYSGNHAPSARR